MEWLKSSQTQQFLQLISKTTERIITNTVKIYNDISNNNQNQVRTDDTGAADTYTNGAVTHVIFDLDGLLLGESGNLTAEMYSTDREPCRCIIKL